MGKTYGWSTALRRQGGTYAARTYVQRDEHYSAYTERYGTSGVERLTTRREGLDDEARAETDEWLTAGFDPAHLADDDQNHGDAEADGAGSGRRSRVRFGLVPHLYSGADGLGVIDEAPALVRWCTVTGKQAELLATEGTSDALAAVIDPRAGLARLLLRVTRGLAAGADDGAGWTRHVVRITDTALISTVAAGLDAATGEAAQWLGALFVRQGIGLPRSGADAPAAARVRAPEWVPRFADLVMCAGVRAALGDDALALVPEDVRKIVSRCTFTVSLGRRLGDRPQFSWSLLVPAGVHVAEGAPAIAEGVRPVLLDGSAPVLLTEFRAAHVDHDIRVIGRDRGGLQELPVVRRVHIEASSAFTRRSLVHAGGVAASAATAVGHLLLLLARSLGVGAQARVLLVVPKPLVDAVQAGVSAHAQPVDEGTDGPARAITAAVERAMGFARDLRAIDTLDVAYQHGTRGTNDYIDHDLVVTMPSRRDIGADRAEAIALGVDGDRYSLAQETAELAQQHHRVRPLLTASTTWLVHAAAEAPRHWRSKAVDRLPFAAGAAPSLGRLTAALVAEQLLSRGMAAGSSIIRWLAEDGDRWARLGLPGTLRSRILGLPDTALHRGARDVLDGWPGLVAVSAEIDGRRLRGRAPSEYGLKRLLAATGTIAAQPLPGTHPGMSIIVVVGRAGSRLGTLVAWTDAEGRPKAARLGTVAQRPQDLPCADRIVLLDPAGVFAKVDWGDREVLDGTTVCGVAPLIAAGRLAGALDDAASRAGVDLGPSPLGAAGLDATTAELASARLWIARVAAWVCALTTARPTGAP